MEPTEAFDDATKCAKSAIKQMANLKVLPYPRNFTIWYTHFSGKYPDLSAFIEKHLSIAGYFAEDRNTLIYQKFFGFDQLSRTIRDVTSQSSRVLSQTVAGLKAFCVESRTAREALHQFNQRMDAAQVSDDVKAMAQEILDRVKNLEAAAEHIEARVNADLSRIAEIHRSIEESQREAMTDALTGIANRNLFDSVLRLAARNPEKARSLSVIIMDIDNLKKFNIAYGTKAGDDVLCAVAKSLTETVKGRDLAARYGSDEFAILVGRTSLADATKLAISIRGAFNATYGPLDDEADLRIADPVTFSIGIAEYEPGESLVRFLDRVGMALATAKAKGRNQIISAEKTSQGIMLWDEDHMVINPTVLAGHDD